jgi:hypothetical protein
VLPLFVVGFVIQRYRGLILRDQRFAQMFLGATAGLVAPALTLVLLINLDTQPLVGWFSLVQWLAMALVGAVVTPFWFSVFDRLHDALVYRPLGASSFRTDREIKRGRR